MFNDLQEKSGEKFNFCSESEKYLRLVTEKLEMREEYDLYQDTDTHLRKQFTEVMTVDIRENQESIIQKASSTRMNELAVIFFMKCVIMNDCYNYVQLTF